MFKKSIKRIAMLFSFLVLGNVVGMSVLTSSVYANEETYEIAKLEDRQLTREEEAKLDPYVELTPNGYVLNDNPYSEEINRLALKKIAIANESLSGKIKTFDYSNKTVTTASASMFSVGITHIEFYWNFVRIYIDAKLINTAISLGLGIAGVYVSAKLVQAALISAGIINTSYPFISDGIWFDYNYYYGPVMALVTYNPYLLLSGITQVGFQ
jgi:hypothetical protein